MNRPSEATRRSFLTGVSTILAASPLSQISIAQQDGEENYPIGLPFDKLWEYELGTESIDDSGHISLAAIQRDTIYFIEQKEFASNIIALRKESHERRWEASFQQVLSSPKVVNNLLFACGAQEFLAFSLDSQPDTPVFQTDIQYDGTGETAIGEDTIWFTDYEVTEIGSGHSERFRVSSGGLHAYSKDGSHKWSQDIDFGRQSYYDGLLIGTAETYEKDADEDKYHQTSGRAVVRDADSGRLNWQSPDNGIFRTHWPPHENVLMAASIDGTIHGYDIESGEEQWRHTVGNQPADITRDDTRIFYAANRSLAAYNPTTDTVEWEIQTPPIYDLTYDQRLLYLGDQNGDFHAYDAKTGEQVWSHSLLGTDQGYEWVVDGTLYCVSGTRLAAFQGKQGKALSQLWETKDNTTLGARLGNLASRDEAIATAEQAIDDHDYDKAFDALDRARTLQTAGSGLVWMTGLSAAYASSRRVTHEYKQRKFSDLVDNLTNAYPISEGVLEGTAPNDLISDATDATDSLSASRLGRPLSVGWIRDDEYSELRKSISSAIAVAPRLYTASTALENYPRNVQTEWTACLTQTLTTGQFEDLTQYLNQFETAVELADLRDSLEHSESVLATDQLSTGIETLLTPDAGLTETDITYFEVAIATIEDYQSAQSTLSNYDLNGVIEKLNESLGAAETKREAAIRNFERIQRLLETGINVESTRSDLDLQYLDLSSQELRDDLQQCLSQVNLNQLEVLASLVMNLKTGIWKYHHLQQFSPTEFEHLVASLYDAQGYETEVSQASNDKGIDVMARNADEILAIQVKQYSRGNKVGRPTVQQLAGARDQVNASKGVIVTSSSFTDTAISASQSYGRGMQLIDRQELLTLLTRSSVSPPQSQSHSHSTGPSSTGRANRDDSDRQRSNERSRGRRNKGYNRGQDTYNGNSGFNSQYCMTCGQEIRGELDEVTDPSGQSVYVCARCKELLEQTEAHQQAAKQEAYEILDLSPDASQDEIEAAYRRKARKTHPDAGGDKNEFLQVQQAYEKLTSS